MMSDTTKLRILFLCRGSSSDGLGHVMRSRTVALAAQRRAEVRMVIIGDQYIDALMTDRGLSYGVHSDDESAMQDVADYHPHIVVMDMLRLREGLLDRIKAQSMAVSLSPVFDRLSSMDMLFHRTSVRGTDWDFARNAGPEERCGLPYTVVRDTCTPIPYQIFEKNVSQDPLSVVVSMGGADASNKTWKVLQAVKNTPTPLLLWVLLGEGYAHSYQDLVDCVKEDSRHEIILAKTSDSMWRIMRTCSLAVLAAGTITYEAAHAGLPSINLFDDMEHVYLIEELLQNGVCLSAGAFGEDGLALVCSELKRLEAAREELLAMHKKCSNLIAGHGAARIIDEMIDQYEKVFRSSHTEKD